MTRDEPPPISSIASAEPVNRSIWSHSGQKTEDRRPHTRRWSWQKIWFDFRVPCHLFPTTPSTPGPTPLPILMELPLSKFVRKHLCAIVTQFGRFLFVWFWCRTFLIHVSPSTVFRGGGPAKHQCEVSFTSDSPVWLLLFGYCVSGVLLGNSRCFLENTQCMRWGGRGCRRAFYLILVSKQMCVFFFLVGCGWIDRQCTYVLLNICSGDHH